jgi:hypothetical protein
MNKIKQSQNKQNNNNINIHDHTVQNEQREYNAYIGGANSIGMGSNLSNKTQKKEIRLKNPTDPIRLPDSHANAAKHPCHRAGLSLALAPRKVPNLKYLDPTTTVET